MDRSAIVRVLVLGVAVALPTHAAANPASEALRNRAAAELYNLERERALELYKQAIAADSNDAAAYRGLATTVWLSITFRRGNMTVDDYLGTVSRQNVKLPPPPPEAAAAFDDAVKRALVLARQSLASNPKSVEAEYEIGAAIGLRASYLATVDGSMFGAFRAAREAYDAHEQVLKLAPGRQDAGLIVGTYRYIVAAMALPLRIAAYAVGFGGGKERGIRLIEAAANYQGDNRADAQVALVLVYNRERRYDDALKILGELRAEYPRNRLFLLESGATCLRAGRAADAERFLTQGISHLASETRPRMFGEDSLWYYKRGTARAMLGRTADAEADLNAALGSDGRKWVQGRAHLELAKLAIKAGNRRAAEPHLRSAIALCDSDNDPASADEARRLLP